MFTFQLKFSYRSDASWSPYLCLNCAFPIDRLEILQIRVANDRKLEGSLRPGNSRDYVWPQYVHWISVRGTCGIVQKVEYLIKFDFAQQFEFKNEDPPRIEIINRQLILLN